MLENPAKIFLGIDPGYDRVGWAFGSVSSRQVTVLKYGCIQTNNSDDIQMRYEQIRAELDALLTMYTPVQAALETIFFSKNQTTAIRVSEARGVIIGELLRHNVTFYEYNPMSIKLAVTGHGKADKAAVEKMVRLQLRIPVSKVKDDAMDALAILLTHAASATTQKRV
ncbi:MAG: crossover junction endodeoxyribonuclease RuvC [bacterium]|nr:crossover junction endodeoxyribonuclease RuvC [bacterium]